MMPVILGKDSGIAHSARWYINLRWLVFCAVCLPSILTDLINVGWRGNTRIIFVFFVVAMTSNALFYFLARRNEPTHYYRILSGAIISIDILLVTAFIFFEGGLESRSIILYTFPILVTAPMYGRLVVYISAAAAVLLYDVQVLLDYLGILRPFNIADQSLHTSTTYVVETIAYVTSVLIVSALIADYITRRLIEKERQASENLISLNKAQYIAKMGSWEWTKQTNNVTYSDGLYTLLHLKPEDHHSRGYGLLQHVHPDDIKGVKRIVNQAIKRGKPYTYNARLIFPDKPIMYVRCEGEPTLNRVGEVIKVYGIVHDITELKQLDIAKSDFVAIASHQLRTPASSVKQYIGMLLGGYAGTVSETQAKMLQTAYESNERQIIIVNDLLYVAQLDSGNLHMKPEVVDMVSLLHSVIEELMPHYMTSEQTIKFSPRFRHLYCKVDPSLIRMVIENIVDNARKYSQPDTPIAISLTHADDQVRIAIADKGVGITNEDLKKLFRKFTRIENPLSSIAGGSGLGLYLAYKLSMMHGGKIEVTSKVGKGSTFTVRLPDTIVVQKRS